MDREGPGQTNFNIEVVKKKEANDMHDANMKPRRLTPVLLTLLTVAVVVEGVFLYTLHQRTRPVKTTRVTTLSTGQLNPPAPFSDPWFNGNPPASNGKQSQPFDDLQKMRRDMDQWFGDFFNKWGPPDGKGWFPASTRFSPSFDLKEHKNEYVVSMDIPGADKSDINVSITDRVLTISGKRDETKKEDDKGKTLRMERRYGTFERSIRLPGPVVAQKMVAHYKNGVLTVNIPKASGDEPQSQTVPVQ